MNEVVLMESIVKKLVLLSVLSLIISSLSGCTNTGAAPEIKQKEPSQAKNSGYPPAPTSMMQATLTKLDGSTFKLADYQGKVLIVNVWATWCGPCRQEIPELVELQKELKDKGFEVIGLNLDEAEDAEMIKEFGKEMSVNYDLVKGDEQLFVEFLKVSKKNAIPQSFLIDRDGKLLGVFVGGGSALKRLIESAHKVTAD